MYNSVNEVAELMIPLKSCDLDGPVYTESVLSRSQLGFYKPTANITFGQKINNMDIIFRSMHIGAQCGTQSRYKVEFDYNSIKTKDDNCTEIDGVCVFDAYEDNTVRFFEKIKSRKLLIKF